MITVTCFEALTAVLLVDVVLLLCRFPAPEAIALGAIAAATAPAATLMVVRQYKADGPVTRALLPVVAIDERGLPYRVFHIGVHRQVAGRKGRCERLRYLLLKPLYRNA